MKSIIDKAKNIKIINIQEDKYGSRFVASVIADGEDVGELMIKKGFAKPYFGATKKGWCD